MKPIGITLGDPYSIGPEIFIKCLKKIDCYPDEVSFKVYARQEVFDQCAQSLGINLSKEIKSKLLFCKNEKLNNPAKTDLKQRGSFCLEAIKEATKEGVSGEIEALVTGPIDKSIVRNVLPDFTGHTDYLAKLAKVPRTLMLLDNGELSVALLTHHVSLREVPSLITEKLIQDTARMLVKDLRLWFSIDQPKLAMTSLNPHAGEIVKNSEEINVMIPAMKALQNEGINIDGPFPADSFFPKARRGPWTTVISPYHDQGLVAAKYPGLDHVVNITLGLPFLRLSPGHGVAFDIAGQGIASELSFERALHLAINRKLKKN